MRVGVHRQGDGGMSEHLHDHPRGDELRRVETPAGAEMRRLAPPGRRVNCPQVELTPRSQSPGCGGLRESRRYPDAPSRLEQSADYLEGFAAAPKGRRLLRGLTEAGFEVTMELSDVAVDVGAGRPRRSVSPPPRAKKVENWPTQLALSLDPRADVALASRIAVAKPIPSGVRLMATPHYAGRVRQRPAMRPWRRESVGGLRIRRYPDAPSPTVEPERHASRNPSLWVPSAGGAKLRLGSNHWHTACFGT